MDLTFITQYIGTIATWFVGLFTPAEWKAFILLIGVTLAATHTIKIAVRLSNFRGGSHAHVYMISAIVGFISAPFIWPTGFSWWVPAVLAGPASAIVFKLVFFIIKKYAPGLASNINAERRRNEKTPPGGFFRRESDKKEEK